MFCMCWLHAVLCGALVTEIEMGNGAVQLRTRLLLQA
jgi:hypothetical protein